MPQILQSADLFFQEGTSDKEYLVELLQRDDGTYKVRARWGRRAQLNQFQDKFSGADLHAAEQQYAALVNAKKAKGYTGDSSGKPYTDLPEDQEEHSGVFPMLLEPIDRGQAAALVQDEHWCFQQKFDGDRTLIELKREGEGQTGIGINRRGLYVALPQDLTTPLLKQFKADYLFDGELVKGVYYVFDILTYQGQDVSRWPYRNRISLLQDEFQVFKTVPQIVVAETAFTSVEKVNLLQALLTGGAEGAVGKHLEAGYERGTRSSKAVKLKFWESATVRVAKVNTKRSIAMELRENGQWIGVGNCTVPPNYELPAAGDLAEITYLYAYRGGSLYQPQYKGKRTDVRPDECTTAQLKYKAEATTA